MDARRADMPRKVRPMLATLVDGPFSDPEWLFEIKWDGYRVIAEIDNGAVKLYSRNQVSLTDQFSPVADTLANVQNKMVLDGEMVVVDDEGRSSFGLLHQYLRTGRGLLVFYVFDILWLDQTDLTDRPLVERKEILRGALPTLANVRVSEHVTGEGEKFFAVVQEKNLEGMVGKRRSSLYRPGARSRDWVKVRNRLSAEVIIGGYTAPKGSRKSFGSLVVGVSTGDRLTYVGHVGTGFADEELAEIGAALEESRIADSPFTGEVPDEAGVRWVEPALIAQVEFVGWTKNGRLRQPAFTGLRADKPVKDVNRELPRKFPLPTDNVELAVDGRTLTITNPRKVLWTRAGITKMDLVEYYRNVADLIVPYLKDRPLILHRFPHGPERDGFFEKDTSTLRLPQWAQTTAVPSASTNREINYLLCQNEASLIYAVNLACIDMNVWNSTIANPDKPDYLVIDLDPEAISFEAVIRTADAVGRVLEELEIESYPKTSGATGIHIYIPLGAKYDYHQVRQFAEILATLTHQRAPEITSLERSPKKRQGRVYPDFLQNRRGATMAAPYSVRPVPGATVSTPLKWSEVGPGLSPDKFTLHNVYDRFEKEGDLFARVLGEAIDIGAAHRRIEDSVSRRTKN